MSRRHLRRWLVLAATLATVIGASLVTTTGAGAIAPRQVQGIDGNKIKVGGLVEAISFGGAEVGFKARFNRANEEKELGKYMIV